MADLSAVTDNMLPIASETFEDALSASIGALATTVPITNLAEYNDGDSVVLTVDPGTDDQATFVGEVQGNNVINCVWTEGNLSASHDTGATVIDYDSATHYDLVTKLLRMIATQDGKLLTSAVQQALNITSAAPPDWTPLANAVQLDATNGQNSFDISFIGADYTDRLSPGMRLRIPRTGTPITQSLDIERNTTQYAFRTAANLANFTTTDTITFEGWIKVESFTGAHQYLISRRATGLSGFLFLLDPTGRPRVFLGNGSAEDAYIADIPVRPGEWTHIAIACQMSTNTYSIYINGALVSGVFTNSAATAFTQVGDLRVGVSPSGVEGFDGLMSDFRIWSTVRTQQQIRDNMYKQLTGGESGLIGYWKFNGDLNDSTSGNNHLTGVNGAVATFVDTPFSANAYGIIKTLPTFNSGNTLMRVETAPGFGIPNETLGTASYSTAFLPYGFPTVLTASRTIGMHVPYAGLLVVPTTNKPLYMATQLCYVNVYIDYTPASQDTIVTVVNESYLSPGRGRSNIGVWMNPGDILSVRSQGPQYTAGWLQLDVTLFGNI